MGLDDVAANALLYSLDNFEVNTSDTVIIGRLRNHLTKSMKKKILKKFHLDGEVLNFEYADEILNTLLHTKIKFLDISDYETGIDIKQDLNKPLKESDKFKYSLVLEAGTIEHVIDCNAALNNLKSLLSIGGILINITPANSWLGHGFYQLSPEFFFAHLNESTGFKILGIFLIQHKNFLIKREKWFEILDPEIIGRRGTIRTKNKCEIVVISKRVSFNSDELDLQQSDYKLAWKGVKISKKGEIFLKMPQILQKTVTLVVFPFLKKYRNPLVKKKIKWSENRIRIK